jgi:3-dehydroquinate dehydratase type II
MEPKKNSIALMNGPNLNRLGQRNPALYGTTTLKSIEDQLQAEAHRRGLNFLSFQSNHEGELIDFIQSLPEENCGILINPGALMMYGYSLRDAIEDYRFPVFEIHISDLSKREDFRKTSILTDVCRGFVSGQGVSGYMTAWKKLIDLTLDQKGHQ